MITWTVRRPAVVWASAVALLLAGAVAFSRLPLATKPRVELPRLQIGVDWPGASAELVETYLTAPIEAAVQTVRGVTKISSQADEGRTQLTVELEEGANVQLSRLAILERMELLRSHFPEGATAPTIGNYVPEALAEQPLQRYTLSGPYTPGTLARLARERIRPRLSAVPGVADVAVSGGAELGVAVVYDATRLRQLGLAPEALFEALQAAQEHRALGEERAGPGERPVVLRDRATSLDALGELPVRAGDGRVFRLGDLAAVRLEEDARDFIYRVNAEPAVGLTVSRLPGADAIRTGAAVRRTIAALRRELPPGMKMRVQYDESGDLARQLRSLVLRGAIAAALVILALVVVLRNLRSVVLALGSGLVAVAGTALGLYLLKIPANLLTLAGLGMGIGILVQNGVVMVDRLRSAPDTADGRADAGRRIAPALLGATLTTAVVLLPFLYLQGNARAAFTPFAVAFALALGCSILSSVVMIPALGAGHGLRHLLWPRALRLYARSVVVLLRWRWAALALVAGLLGYTAWGLAHKVPRFDFSTWYGQRSNLIASLNFPRGSDPASLDRGIREFERVVVGRPGVDQAVVQGWRDGAYMQVTFAPDADQTPIPYELREELTQRAILIGGATVRVHYQGPGYYSGGGGGIPQYRIKLLGYSYAGVERIAWDLKRRLERIPRIRDVDVNATRSWGQEKAYAVTLEPDRAALARYGLTAGDLARAVAREVSGAVGGGRLLELGGVELRVRLKAAGARDRSLDELRAALVPNRSRAPVRVGDLAGVAEREALARIDREDQQYVRVISYEFRGPPKLGDRIYKSFLNSISVPPGYSVGEESWFGFVEDESAKGLWFVFAIGVVLVMLSVAIVFDSVWASTQVFLSLPVALAGSAAAFWIAGAAFTREAAVGAILVVGLAVNQAVLLADALLSKRRAAGRQAQPLSGLHVVAACRDRAGMIVLVTLTTLASVLPMAIGTDPGQLFGAIALATAGGTVAGTLGALWVVPLLAARWRWPFNIRRTS
ncbi:MAG TPA: efflux RND transporter permease subunit [Gemmatimonadales bacterium]|nr:efflux RND transporter permease subunit [Gemmatimonadales bacterium]